MLHRFPSVCLSLVCLLVLAGPAITAPALADTFGESIQPLLQKHCQQCHGGGDEIHGDFDLTQLDHPAAIDAAFETWERAVELVDEGLMPPDDQPPLSDTEKQTLRAWYQDRFVESVGAHPGYFRPRRLSAHEYRNTLHSLLGFPLEVAIRKAEETLSEESLVMKLLPTDPPGPSGFTNDTSGNPLTTVLWDQYSYLVDNGLEKLFSSQHRDALQAYTGSIEGPWLTPAQAETMLRRFARRVYRRDLSDAQINDMLAALQGKHEAALQTALQREMKAILMSPSFLYRGLHIRIATDVQVPVDDFELAERLSYFLWADMPDDELLDLAGAGQLAQADVLDAQITRMLASPKARNLAEDFGLQWFSLGEIDHVSNNPSLVHGLKNQPLDFLHYLFTQDRPLLELLDSRTTFINAHTARYYGAERRQLKAHRRPAGVEVQALPNQKIQLNDNQHRGGLLTMPGVLAMNRGPVLRGTWLLERVLGEHLPDPPANIGQVPANRPGEKLSFRQRFELHRSDATCAVCHDKIDPLGFSLQAYDDQGKVLARTKHLDTSGTLPSGESFDDFSGLKQILVTDYRERVIRNIVRQMMAYALARKLQAYDRPTVDQIVAELIEQDGTYRDLIAKIVNSLPFRETVKRSAQPPSKI
ncbi:hypothetical protein UC8_21330 [Roseimaritima ulvae]|uniref:Planctomycete cytochrome C n=2 Tax=Roseimaritima ulvae TaxID=980254 RepID=A0A5B9QM12_9BACT|nr:hypothetical protein UC8_21330 [Roseimaritima ulvae]